jgi:hypothetical protein
MQAMVTGWFFLTALLLRPQLRGEGFVLRDFFKMVGAAPQTPRGSSSRLVFDEMARALWLVSVLLVFCVVVAADGLLCRMIFYKFYLYQYVIVIFYELSYNLPDKKAGGFKSAGLIVPPFRSVRLLLNLCPVSVLYTKTGFT